MDRAETVSALVRQYRYRTDHAQRITEIARTHGLSCSPSGRGMAVTVRYRGEDKGFSVSPGVPTVKELGFRATQVPREGYTSSTVVINTNPKRSERAMARGKTAAAVVEPEEDEAAEKDYTVYADKPATPLMQDFAEWIKQEVGVEFPSKAAEAAFDNGVRLGGTLRMEFQRSDFCKERRAERQAERENEAKAAKAKAAPAPKGKRAAATEPDEEELEETPKATGRGRASARAQAKPGRPAATTAKRGRGRAASSEDDDEAPY